MKLTRDALKQIIKEELEQLTQESIMAGLFGRGIMPASLSGPGRGATVSTAEKPVQSDLKFNDETVLKVFDKL